MFSGIVEECGEVHGLTLYDGGVRFEVWAKFATEAGAIAIGDSIAVNGCCLTAVTIEDGRLGFDLLAETQRVTNLRDLSVGGVVNLERSLKFDGRVGGHFVTGHIDTTAEIALIEPRGEDVYLEINVAERFRHYLVSKGSIAVDGISLTVAEVTEEGFAVWLIPHTLAVTNLGHRKTGEHVNLEFDMLAKYVERMVAPVTAK